MNKLLRATLWLGMAYSFIDSAAAFIPGWRKVHDYENEGRLKLSHVGLSEKGHVMALAHFTSELTLDAFVLNDNASEINVYLYSEDQKKYTKSNAAISVKKNMRIVNIVVSDFTHDGFTDVWVMLQHKQEAENEKAGIMHELYSGNGIELQRISWDIPASRDQLVLVDWHGTMHIDLLGMSMKDDKNVSLWLSESKDSDSKVDGYHVVPAPQPLCSPTSPNFAGVADFDGDGRADLFWPCAPFNTTADGISSGVPSFQVWLNRDDGFALSKRWALPFGTGPITMTDVDGDGLLDLLFVVCYPTKDCSKESSIHIMYNMQRKFCSRHKKYEDCKPRDHLFVADNSFDFDSKPGTAHHHVLPLDSIVEKGMKVLTVDPFSLQPLALHFGDYDADGYPDLLLTLVPRDSASIEKSRVALLQNVACSHQTCLDIQIAHERRTFKEVKERVEDLAVIKYAIHASFIDIAGHGIPDILVNGYDDMSSKKAVHYTVRNLFFRDSFFLRAETLNSVCPHPCSAKQTGSLAKIPYGVNYPGATYRITFTDNDETNRVRQASQLAQTSYCALQPPNVIFGLGRTNNFIDNVFVGVTSRRFHHWHSRHNIIPNSDLIIIPPHPDNTSWRIELRIKPGEYFLWVLISVVTALLVLVVITSIFKYREVHADELEKKRSLHAINFDAM